MKRPHLFIVLALIASVPAAAQDSEPVPTSIVFILADDMGIGDVRCFNPQGKIATPCMDKLASQGMRLNDAHSPSAVCTPTRYGILTGRYAWRGSLKKGVLWGASPPLIEEGRPTVASFLKDSGYATACVGKWHLGLGIPRRKGGKLKGHKGQHWDLDYEKPLTNTPLNHGFDHFYGVSASLDMPPYVWIDDNRWTEIPTVSKAFFRNGAAARSFEAVDVLDGITTHAVDWIKETSAANPKQPFFLYVPLTAPHTPIVPSARWKGKSGLGSYADFVMEVDDTVGRISAAIEAAGRTDSTLFIITSDNGCAPPGMKQARKIGHDPSAGFRGHKADIYEGGHRVPFIARWPGHIVKGSRSTETVCLTDLFATAADLTGQPLPPNAAEDSISLLPVLTQTTRQPKRTREAVVHHSVNGSFAIRKGNLKLNLCPGSGGWSDPRPDKAKKLKLPPQQLFELTIDPAETKNLATEHPAIAEQLTNILQGIINAGQSTYLAASGLTHTPLIGASAPGTITLWTHAATASTWIATATAVGQGHTAATATATATPDNNLNMTFRMQGLKPGKSYTVTLHAEQSAATAWTSTYTAGHAIPKSRPARILFGSCADEKAGTAGTYRQMATEEADLIVLLGDTPYIDTTKLAKQRSRHLDFLGFPPTAALLSTTPFLATWDDHDFGKNDVDGRLKNKENSRRAFVETHPNPTHGENGAGIYTRHRVGDADIFLLDTRWFSNTASTESDPSRQTLLGKSQWAWLEKGLASSTAPAKLIACGMIWNGATRPNKTDHWGYWPHEIERLFRFIGKHRIKGVTLIGGDIHRSRVIRHAAADQAGYDIIELITSPMHNSIIEAANAPHPGLMWDAGAIYTYLAVDIDHRSSKAPMLRARFMNRDGKELFKTSIPLTQ